MTSFFHNPHSEPAIKRQPISILHGSFDDKSMGDTGPRHSEALRPGCQLMLKRHTYMRWIMRAIRVWRRTWRVTIRPAMSLAAIMCQRQQQRRRNDAHFQRLTHSRHATTRAPRPHTASAISDQHAIRQNIGHAVFERFEHYG